MKVCLIVEGAYPYLTGGVSSWIQQLIGYMPNTEFVVQALCANRQTKQEMRYKPPDNLTEIRNVYLSDEDYIGKGKTAPCSGMQWEKTLRDLLFRERVDWEALFDLFQQSRPSLNSLLGGKAFLETVLEYCQRHLQQVVFTDVLWTMRSMYLPVFQCLCSQPLKADLYHAVSTGYAGILGSYQSRLYQAPFLLSEHGIYTREREEEIIRASWVQGIYKDLWIQQFRKISTCSYLYATAVTSLFEEARELQIELGCQRSKTLVIPNGVRVSRFEGKPAADNSFYVNVGALLRVTPIKDVKTLISAFAIAKSKDERLKLWIMGPLDENPDYVAECQSLVRTLGVEDIVFTGPVDSSEYIAKMDFMVLTSLSEGQPLTILEGFAAGKPSIVTNVGSCRELVEGKGEDTAAAGFVTPPINPELSAAAMLRLAGDPALRKKMGQAGKRRVQKYYNEAEILDKFVDLYQSLFRAKAASL